MAKSGNTSNLLWHLRNNHKTPYAQLKSPSSRSSGTAVIAPVSSQSTIQAAFVRSQPYTRESLRWTDSVTCCLVADELPIYIVQKEGLGR